MRLLVRKGIIGPEAADDDPPALGPIYAASVEQKLATGERAGQRPQRGRSAATVPTSRGPRRGARLDGFDLHASAAVRGGRRRRLERLARYLLRPPVAQNRLEENGDRILLHLLRPWRDGSIFVVFSPHELLERLAALVPRPHSNLIIYHGVLAGHSAWRDRAVSYGRAATAAATTPAPVAPTSDSPRRPNPLWADMMRRGLDLDVLACPRCGGRLRFVGCVTDPTVARRIADGLACSDEARPPPPPPAPTEPKSPFRLRLDRLRPSHPD